MLKFARLLTVVVAFIASTVVARADHPTLQSVTSLTAAAPSSALIAFGSAWTPLVAGGDGTRFWRADGDEPFLGTAPQLVAVARQWGKGRILCTSRAFTTNAASNNRFQVNAHAWLRNGRPGFIRWTTSHAEQSELGYFLINFASSVGQGWLPIVGPVGTPELAATGVLYIDDPDLQFSDSERTAIMNWVAAGGGLWVNASGNRWVGAHGRASVPEYDHPVARLLSGTGLHPVRGSITRRIDEQTIVSETNFDVLGGNALTGDLITAGDELSAIHLAQGAALAVNLTTDAALRARFTALHAVLAYPCTLGMTGDDVLTAASVCVQVYNASVGFYNHGANYHAPNAPAAFARERLWRTYIDSGLDDAAIRAQVASIAGWVNSRRTLFVDRQLMILDNQDASAAQANSILAWLSRMPAERVPLRAVTIRDFLGTASPELSLDGKGYKINVVRDRPASSSEPPFPAPYDGWLCDIFAQVTAHEVTHVLDSAYIYGNPQRAARRAALLADAGNDPLNYLRSGFEPGFFQANQLEFIASIANQWVAESDLCFRLGKLRFDAGRRQPIEQALFFADMFSTGNTVPFFRCRTNGTISTRTATLARDAQGRIISVIDGSVAFHVTYDAQGHVATVAEVDQDCDGDGVADVDEILFLDTAADTNFDMRIDGCTGFNDINHDGVIDGSDLAWLLSRWGLLAVAAPEADLDQDGVIGGGDLAILLNNWGPVN